MLNKSTIQMSSNRSFGLVFFFIFLLLALWPLINDGQIRFWSVIISIIFLLLGIINSKFLTPLNLLWFKFGMLLGSIFAPIVMMFVFFLVVTPIGFTMRIMGKDLLNKKRDKKKETYWINREKSAGSMKRQF